jgi:hypothetical protein
MPHATGHMPPRRGTAVCEISQHCHLAASLCTVTFNLLTDGSVKAAATLYNVMDEWP